MDDWRIEIYDADTGEKLSYEEVKPSFKGIRAPKWLAPGKVYHTRLLNTGEWAILQQHERGYWYTSPMPRRTPGE